ncbi:MAG: hypothetical protein IKI36_01725 [Prevotella sp.]|nr:hypothetical protein [Prevotella sp.]
MIEQGFSFYFITVLITVLLLGATIFIPLYGFFRKRFKGLAVGCVLQPFVCAIICLLVTLFIVFYEKYEVGRYRKAAMVTVKKTDSIGNVHTWDMKADEECLYEFVEKDEAEKDSKYLMFNKFQLFDVVPMDSFRVCVDDKIVVRFDLQNRKATAVEYDEPIKVVNVDWEKVDDFFKKHP